MGPFSCIAFAAVWGTPVYLKKKLHSRRKTSICLLRNYQVVVRCSNYATTKRAEYNTKQECLLALSCWPGMCKAHGKADGNKENTTSCRSTLLGCVVWAISLKTLLESPHFWNSPASKRGHNGPRYQEALQSTSLKEASTDAEATNNDYCQKVLGQEALVRGFPGRLVAARD